MLRPTHHVDSTLYSRSNIMTNTVCVLLLLSLFSSHSNIAVYGYKSTYKKPKPSNGPCIDNIERMESITEESNLNCLGCYDQSQPTCPTEIKCQTLIDDIYRTCDKVTLPHRRFFFDPPVS